MKATVNLQCYIAGITGGILLTVSALGLIVTKDWMFGVRVFIVAATALVIGLSLAETEE